MKYKVDHYKIYNKGRIFDILAFPRVENAWAFDDFPEDDQLMLDGCPEFYRMVHHAVAALLENPQLIIFFPIKHPGYTGYGDHMTYDAVLLRPELQFKRSEWYDLKSRLDKQHWVGKYTIHHDEKKLNDFYEKNYEDRYWVEKGKDTTEEIIGDTLFLVMPKEVCYRHHASISRGLKEFDPDYPYGEYAGIGYIMPVR